MDIQRLLKVVLLISRGVYFNFCSQFFWILIDVSFLPTIKEIWEEEGSYFFKFKYGTIDGESSLWGNPLIASCLDLHPFQCIEWRATSVTAAKHLTAKQSLYSWEFDRHSFIKHAPWVVCFLIVMWKTCMLL